jgi:hypothetical protein
MTLNEVLCLLHLSIEDRLLDHDEKSSKESGVELVIDLIGIDLNEADK